MIATAFVEPGLNRVARPALFTGAWPRCAAI